MRTRRVDANHGQIAHAFSRLGFSVLDLSRVGCGCPDLLVAKQGHSVLVEIKDGMKSASRRKLTPAEQEFRLEWRGRLVTVTCLDDVMMIDKTLLL